MAMLLPLVGVSLAASGLQMAASAAVGASTFLFARWVTVALASEDLPQGEEWRYDISRINELRRVDLLYRLFQPLVQLLGRVNRVMFGEFLPRIQQEIQAAGLPRFWLAEEYLARAEVIAMCLAPCYAYFLVSMFGTMTGLMFTALMTLLVVWLLRRRLASQAACRLRLIKRRMPFLLDLLTLLMEAGSTFLGALSQAVEEFGGHPVAEEFSRVLTDMSLGKTRAEAFYAMRDRLRDDEITSILGAIVQGEHLGTPLARIFHTQADVLRMKRTQRAETVAGEAGVNMLLPTILVMVSTVLIILGPFLMNYLYLGFYL
jgi:tight adherence protein C